jgi:hypothetical protein
MGSTTSPVAAGRARPRRETRRKERGIAAAMVGAVLTVYAGIGYGLYLALAALF